MTKPFGIRALNAVGGALRAVGLPLVGLDPDALLARAARTAGLDDYGDDHFRAPLRLLLRSFEKEARLTVLGRMIAQADVLRLLQNRLRMTAERTRHPEIGDGEIRRPLFIVGLPRTGTTILHELLAQDPANRVPMTWEVHSPWPPPERASYDTDPRIAEVERGLAQVDRIMPGFKAMHAMGARLPQECVAFTAHDFASMIHLTTHRIPSYASWLEHADLRWVYASHRRQLQYFQWRCPAEQWVLKSPAHLWALDALLDVYPDACFVQTHRDPVRVVASLCSLVTALRSMASDDVDPHEVAAEWTTRLADVLAVTTAARDDGRIAAARIFDLPFHELLGNEIASIRRLYEHFGRTLSSEAQTRMERYLAAHPQSRHGGHRYRFADTGLDLATERQRYAAYSARYAVREEKI